VYFKRLKDLEVINLFLEFLKIEISKMRGILTFYKEDEFYDYSLAGS
jgi:hypothetical protein